MEPLFLTLISITGIFLVMLILKEFLSKKIKKDFCVICLAVSLTWITLFLLYLNDYFQNKTILAILMGQTVLGLFYLFNKKLKVFKLPFLLTGITLIYFILEKNLEIRSLLFLGSLWILLGGIYLFKSNKKINSVINKLIECCKNW